MSAEISQVTKKLILYSPYERLWHWLQTLMVMALLFTGAVIRYPDALSQFDFEMAVHVHNIIAAMLLINAGLALFYFVATGEIRQYTIEKDGFVSGLLKQVLYYGMGIFRGATHPFSPRREKRLNLLQRLSYLMLLNVLLPLQVLSGLALYFADKYPAEIDALGGLPVLAEIHAACAWLFLTFIIMHMYLTTTGHTVLEHVKTMVLGYKELHEEEEAASKNGKAQAEAVEESELASDSEDESATLESLAPEEEGALEHAGEALRKEERASADEEADPVKASSAEQEEPHEPKADTDDELGTVGDEALIADQSGEDADSPQTEREEVEAKEDSNDKVEKGASGKSASKKGRKRSRKNKKPSKPKGEPAGTRSETEGSEGGKDDDKVEEDKA